jgi:methylated-DNA-[protein]-cysteine S-methyltransferase
MTETIYFKKWSSPIGDLFFYSTDKALLALVFQKKNIEASAKTNPIIEEAISQLKEYFKGERKTFNLPLKPIGTDFQMRAWRALKKIPFGKTISYKEQAALLKIDKAFRAVGTANGKNPISIIIPCHRVISSTGKISGYAGGPKIKAALLEMEGLKTKGI